MNDEMKDVSKELMRIAKELEAQETISVKMYTKGIIKALVPIPSGYVIEGISKLVNKNKGIMIMADDVVVDIISNIPFVSSVLYGTRMTKVIFDAKIFADIERLSIEEAKATIKREGYSIIERYAQLSQSVIDRYKYRLEL